MTNSPDPRDDTLTGVVEPELPGMPEAYYPSEEPEEQPLYLQVYDAAAETIAAALQSTQASLLYLRGERDKIAGYIRQLVEEEKRLQSMMRIAGKKVEP